MEITIRVEKETTFGISQAIRLLIENSCFDKPSSMVLSIDGTDHNINIPKEIDVTDIKNLSREVSEILNQY